MWTIGAPEPSAEDNDWSELYLSQINLGKEEDEENAPELSPGDRDWAELHPDALVVIFRKMGTLEVLSRASKVCRPWRKVAKCDPLLWRRIDMGTGGKDFSRLYKYDGVRKKWRRSSLNGSLAEMAKVAVDWGGSSVEQLLIGSFCDNDLLDYIADRASNLKRLSLIGLGNSAYISHGRMAKALGRLKQLEELEFERCKLPQGVIMNAIGVMCPQLKRLKLQKPSFERIYYEEESNLTLGIPKTMHRLEYLQLLCLCTRNEELMKILAKCPNLKMLDLRGSTVYKSYDSSIRVKDDKLRAQCSRILTLMLSHGMSSQTHKQYDDISDDACCLIHWMPTSKHYCLC